MNDHPINLALRFLLEIAALLTFGAWGWQRGEGFWRWVLMLGLPILAGFIWATFRVPNDPGPAPVNTHGVVRLAMELAFFAAATWILFDIKLDKYAWALAIVTLLHYAVSYDRVWWLLTK